MTEETARDIEKRLIALLARLEERCPQHRKEIEANKADIDAAFDRIRKGERDLGVAMKNLEDRFEQEIHKIQLHQSKWSLIGTGASSAITGIIVMVIMKLFVIAQTVTTVATAGATP